MRTINDIINEERLPKDIKLNADDNAYCAIITYLLAKLYKSDRKSCEWMLSRVDEKIYENLLYFLGNCEKFDEIPELFCDEEPKVYLDYFDRMAPEEIDSLVK